MRPTLNLQALTTERDFYEIESCTCSADQSVIQSKALEQSPVKYALRQENVIQPRCEKTRSLRTGLQIDAGLTTGVRMESGRTGAN